MEIYFRAFEPEDYKLTQKWRNDREITDSLGGNTFYVSERREKDWVEKITNSDRENLYLAICLCENKQLVGFCSLTSIDLLNRKAELSIVIGERSLQGKGIGKKSVIKLLSHGFEELNLNKIWLKVLAANQRAINLYTQCGFYKEGLLRQDLFKNNKYHDVIIMSILNSEYNA